MTSQDTRRTRRTPVDPWTESCQTTYEAAADTLVGMGFVRVPQPCCGDTFRLPPDGLQVQLARRLGTCDWYPNEVGTMRRIEWHELRDQVPRKESRHDPSNHRPRRSRLGRDPQPNGIWL